MYIKKTVLIYHVGFCRLIIQQLFFNQFSFFVQSFILLLLMRLETHQNMAQQGTFRTTQWKRKAVQTFEPYNWNIQPKKLSNRKWRDPLSCRKDQLHCCTMSHARDPLRCPPSCQIFSVGQGCELPFNWVYWTFVVMPNTSLIEFVIFLSLLPIDSSNPPTHPLESGNICCAAQLSMSFQWFY